MLDGWAALATTTSKNNERSTAPATTTTASTSPSSVALRRKNFRWHVCNETLVQALRGGTELHCNEVFTLTGQYANEHERGHHFLPKGPKDLFVGFICDACLFNGEASWPLNARKQQNVRSCQRHAGVERRFRAGPSLLALPRRTDGAPLSDAQRDNVTRLLVYASATGEQLIALKSTLERDRYRCVVEQCVTRWDDDDDGSAPPGVVCDRCNSFTMCVAHDGDRALARRVVAVEEHEKTCACPQATPLEDELLERAEQQPLRGLLRRLQLPLPASEPKKSKKRKSEQAGAPQQQQRSRESDAEATAKLRRLSASSAFAETLGHVDMLRKLAPHGSTMAGVRRTRLSDFFVLPHCV